MTDALVAATDLSVLMPVRGGGGKYIRAVDGVSLSVGRGEIVGLVGESGSGKTTTGRALLRLCRPSAGTITFDGHDITRLSQARLRPLRHRMQMIFQHPQLSLNPRLPIGRSIAEPLEAARVARAEGEGRVAAMLDRVGLPASARSRYPHELSGGQLQRVAIARALVGQPDFVLADEPLSSLDLSVQAQIVALLKSLQQDFVVSLLFITHDLSIAEYASDRVAVMYLGKLVEIAPARGFSRTARHSYSRALLDAAPRPDPVTERRRATPGLAGEIPSALSPPTGCAFHPRCPLAIERCRDAAPPLLPRSAGHEVACWVA